jgi:tetratricopeptide (TPR) repeat protein
VSFDDLLRDMAKALVDVPERTGEGLRAEFSAACRRLDDDLRKQQQINAIADQFEEEEALYARATAAADRRDADTAVPMLRQCAEAGLGEAAWLLAQLLDSCGNTSEAMTWYRRARDDGDTRAAAKLAMLHARQLSPATSTSTQPATRAERGRPSSVVNAADGAAPHCRPAAPGMARGRDASRAADYAVHTTDLLPPPGRDLRAMSCSGREEATDTITRLRELLRQCPAGELGTEGSAMVLTTIATVSEALTADRDERTALHLIQAASPHLLYLGRRHPAALEVRRARAEALSGLGRYQEAKTILRRMSTDEERVFGTDDPRTALLLAWALAGSGQLRDAEAGFRALEARLARPRGGGTLLQRHLQCRHSWLLGQLGLDAESAAGYDSVIINRSHEQNADHPDVLDARHSKGKMLVLAGNGPQAVTLLSATAEDRARVQGGRHPDTLETLKYLHLARAQAEPRDDRVLDRAINGLEHILRTQDRSHGPRYPMSHDTAEQLRRLLRLREAIRFRQPVPRMRQVPIPDEGETVLLIPAMAATRLLTRLPEGQ